MFSSIKMVPRRQPIRQPREWTPTDDMNEKIRQYNLRQLALFRQIKEDSDKFKAKRDAELAASTAKHNAVREEVMQWIRDEQEREKRAEEEKRQRQLRLVEEARLEKLRLEEEERRREAERVAEEARRRAEAEEELRRAHEAAVAEAKRVIEEQERARLLAIQQAEEERLRREAEAAAAAQAAAEAEERERTRFRPDPLHPAYVDLHQRLKQLRHDTVELTKDRRTNPNMPPDERQVRAKQFIGDVRREIRKIVGQFVVGKGRGANSVPTRNLIMVLKAARDDKLTPLVDCRHFIIEGSRPDIPFSSASQQHADPNMPAVFLYAMNILAKAVVSQWSNEASVHPKKAQPVGIAAMHAFSTREFCWGGRSLIDMLIAKMHKVCPVLFGIYGPEETEEGKVLLGWARDGRGGPWVPTMRHHEIQCGLGAGFGAIAMRNFSKSRNENPFPNWNMWNSLSWMVKVPLDELTSTHFVVLKAMLEGHCMRFLEFFGDLGRRGLWDITVDFPKRAPHALRSAAGALGILPDLWKRDLGVDVRMDPTKIRYRVVDYEGDSEMTDPDDEVEYDEDEDEDEEQQMEEMMMMQEQPEIVDSEMSDV
ncbi:MAG: chaperone ATPase hsp78 [Watsoniomyces obsoletus]|nr:MAG: chaperone ATPase hsp78 [Watsoniomyces obsoletus]